MDPLVAKRASDIRGWDDIKCLSSQRVSLPGSFKKEGGCLVDSSLVGLILDGTFSLRPCLVPQHLVV